MDGRARTEQFFFSRALWEPIDRDLALRARQAFEILPR